VCWRWRRSDAGILDREVEEKNPVDLPMKSAVALPEIPTWLGTQRK